MLKTFALPGSPPDPSPQIPATQPMSDASDPAATAPQSSGIATSPDKGVDAAVRADALTTPPASDAAATLEAAAQAGVGIAAQSVGENFRLQMAPSAAAMIPSKGDLLQPTGKSAQKNTADAAGAKNSDTATATNSVQAKAADSSGTAADASSHNSQSNGQLAQHSQPDSSQSVVAMPKVTDSGAAQAQPVPPSAVSHEATISTGATSGVQDGTHQGLERSDTGSSGLDGDELTAATGIDAGEADADHGRDGDAGRAPLERVRRHLDSDVGDAAADAGADLAGPWRPEPGHLPAHTPPCRQNSGTIPASIR